MFRKLEFSRAKRVGFEQEVMRLGLGRGFCVGKDEGVVI